MADITVNIHCDDLMAEIRRPKPNVMKLKEGDTVVVDDKEWTILSISTYDDYMVFQCVLSSKLKQMPESLYDTSSRSFRKHYVRMFTDLEIAEGTRDKFMILARLMGKMQAASSAEI